MKTHAHPFVLRGGYSIRLLFVLPLFLLTLIPTAFGQWLDGFSLSGEFIEESGPQFSGAQTAGHNIEYPSGMLMGAYGAVDHSTHTIYAYDYCSWESIYQLKTGMLPDSLITSGGGTSWGQDIDPPEEPKPPVDPFDGVALALYAFDTGDFSALDAFDAQLSQLWQDNDILNSLANGHAVQLVSPDGTKTILLPDTIAPGAVTSIVIGLDGMPVLHWQSSQSLFLEESSGALAAIAQQLYKENLRCVDPTRDNAQIGDPQAADAWVGPGAFAHSFDGWLPWSDEYSAWNTSMYASMFLAELPYQIPVFQTGYKLGVVANSFVYDYTTSQDPFTGNQISTAGLTIAIGIESAALIIPYRLSLAYRAEASKFKASFPPMVGSPEFIGPVQPSYILSSDALNLDWVAYIPKGSRPHPSSYLSVSERAAHKSLFEAGAARIQASSPTGTIGKTETWVIPRSTADDLIKQANGSVTKLEQLLGLNSGDLGNAPVLIDIPQPTGYRIPTGNEFGANNLWRAGGYTSGGLPEAVISPATPGSYTVQPVF